RQHQQHAEKRQKPTRRRPEIVRDGPRHRSETSAGKPAHDGEKDPAEQPAGNHAAEQNDQRVDPGRPAGNQVHARTHVGRLQPSAPSLATQSKGEFVVDASSLEDAKANASRPRFTCSGWWRDSRPATGQSGFSIFPILRISRAWQFPPPTMTLVMHTFSNHYH